MDSIQSIDNMILEMRRGVIVLAVLSQCSQEQYGYSLMKNLAEKGLEIDRHLYPCCGAGDRDARSSWRLEDHAPPLL
jgi:hypothetical protein